jgi:hypothetical protein
MKDRFILIATCLLIILWVYTAGSKVSDFQDFKHQLRLQHFGPGMISFLLWFIPAIEFTAAILLTASRSRLLGLYLSGILLAGFTLYVLLILSGYYINVPCSCGGVIKSMGWRLHLLFNLSFLLLNIGAIYISYHKERRSGKLASN